MARILYLHGSSAGPFSDKADHLERHGHHVVGPPGPNAPEEPTDQESG